MTLLLLALACREPSSVKFDTATDSAVDSGDVDADIDGDGYSASVDCADDDASIHPDAVEVCNGLDDDCDGAPDDGAGIAWYTDADADGWGDDATAAVACAAVPGQVGVNGDCADDDPSRHPGAAETDCSDPVDYNCDGSAAYADADADGYAACLDCDDATGATHPDAVEACNGVDDDCDGAIDDGAADMSTFYEDDDGDGFGDALDAVSACAATAGLVTDATDCDDRDATAFPGAAETCDDDDDDCDGAVDEEAVDMSTWYLDDDGDGWGVETSAVACDPPSRYVAEPGDCDDADAAVFPTQTEVCNDVDDDCDGDVDGTAIDRITWYTDADADGYGDPSTASLACDPADGVLRNARDCDDADPSVWPYAWEDVTNGVDDDCDGLVDTADVTVVNDVTASLGDDVSLLIAPAAFSFPLCANTYGSLYIESNGRLNFGTADSDYNESGAKLLSDVSVAALWDDVDPRFYGATVEWIEHDDALAVSWRGVPQYGGADSSTAQVVLFDDGRIQLTWGDVALTDTVVGYACALDTSIAATDLSSAAPDAGRWGLGEGDEVAVWEGWDGSSASFDLANSHVRLCGMPGSGDPCADE